MQNSKHHLPTALANVQKSLSSHLNETMKALKQEYPNQEKIFENAINDGVIVTSGICFSMHKDFKNQDSWEKEKEEYQLAFRNLKGDYPNAFNSNSESEESLLFLSNMDTIKERLENATKEKERIISQKLQEFVEKKANGLHSLITKLLEDIEEEKTKFKALIVARSVSR
ncbi:putative tRNA modification GTPase TrmE [Helicobacter acinonychis]|uniref:Uncharacterized protein n=1 Tax=Helicobacter acinonychis (strain Sheeba) TaxID=382638 RepID=Q17X18_HELAH|nr:hypothetical protein fragment 4 [Helicobacter acinonychis str. Sheeba]STP04360.1 putative tRNA modification GTPase TrmE [Helicobacter acinonychis]